MTILKCGRRAATFRGAGGLTGMDRPSRREALALLYERHYAELVRLAFALTNDWALAEDLAQGAFVRVWRSWGNIRDPQSAPAYLRTSVVNLARRSLRRRLLERRAWRWRGAGDLRSGHGKVVDDRCPVPGSGARPVLVRRRVVSLR